MIKSAVTRLGDCYLACLERLVGVCVRHAIMVAIAATVLAVLSVFYIVGHFGIDTNTSAMLSRDLPFQKSQAAIDKAFPQLRDTLVAVVDGNSPGQAEHIAGELADWARADTHDFQFVYRPGGGDFFANNGLLYLSRKQLDSLARRLTRSQPLVAVLARDPSLASLFGLLNRAMNSKQGALSGELNTVLGQIGASVAAFGTPDQHAIDWQHLVAGNDAGGDLLSSTRRFVILKPHFDYSEIQPATVPIAHLRAKIAALHLASGERVRLTGSVMLDNDQLSAVEKGTGWATGLAFIFVIILLSIALRSVRRVAAALLTLICGLIWTTAFALLSVGEFNILSVAFAVLFIGIAVDLSIQYCMRSRDLAERETQRHRVLRAAAWEIGGALSLAACAAAASFFSVVPTDYAGLADLGLISGVGMLIALAANLTLLPALLHLFGTDHPRASIHDNSKPTYFSPLVRHYKAVVVVSIIIGLVAIPFALHIRFDFDPMSLVNPNTEAVKTIDQLAHSDRFSPYTINILAPSLADASKLASKLDDLATVKHAVTLASFIPEHQQAKLARIRDLVFVLAAATMQVNTPGKPDMQATQKATRELIKTLQNETGNPTGQTLARHLAKWQSTYGQNPQATAKLQQQLLGTLPGLLKRLRTSMNAHRVTMENLPQALKARYQTADGRARIEVSSSLDLTNNANMQRFVSDVQGVAPHAAGSPVLLVAGGQTVIRAFIQASVVAFILIAILLWLALRRWRAVALALSPLPLAGLLTAATMVGFGLSFNMGNIIVLPLLIGLGVAYGIYFVVSWQKQHSLTETMHSSIPGAVLFSALTTGCSFGSLALAPSRGMQILGTTLSIALAFILLTTLLVLPALLSWMQDFDKYKAGQPDSGT